MGEDIKMAMYPPVYTVGYSWLAGMDTVREELANKILQNAMLNALKSASQTSPVSNALEKVKKKLRRSL